MALHRNLIPTDGGTDILDGEGVIRRPAAAPTGIKRRGPRDPFGSFLGSSAVRKNRRHPAHLSFDLTRHDELPRSNCIHRQYDFAQQHLVVQHLRQVPLQQPSTIDISVCFVIDDEL